MPKRKRERFSDDNYDYLTRKLKKLERKMKYARRRRTPSSSSDDSKQSPYNSPERRSIAIVDDDYEENEVYSPGRSSWYDFSESVNGTPQESVVQYITADVHPPPTDAPRRPRSVVATVSPQNAAVPQVELQATEAQPTPSAPPAPPAPHARPALHAPPGPPAPSSSTAAVPGISGAPTQHPPTDDVASSSGAQVNELQVIELDSDIMQILGDDPTCTKEYGPDIQRDLAIRLSHTVTSGLTKENRKELKEKYIIPSNCKLIRAPYLNPEMHASLMESQAKRDKGIENKQNMTSCALSSLSAAITMLLSSENKNPELLKLLMDTARILGDIQHSDSVLRRFFILSTVKKDLKDQLEKTQIDEMLFGSNLSEFLKSAKTISKSGADIRSASSAKSTAQSTTKTLGRPLNYRAPPARGRPAAAGSARGARHQPPAPNSRRMTTRPTQYNASKTSSHHQRHRR